MGWKTPSAIHKFLLKYISNCWTLEKSSASVQRWINNWWRAEPSNHTSGILPFLSDISSHAHLCWEENIGQKHQTNTNKLTNAAESVFVGGIHSCFMRSSPECPHVYDVKVFMRPFLQIFSSIFANKESWFVYDNLTALCHNVYGRG